MSEQSPSQFLKAAKQDETLKQKLVDAKSIDERVAIANSYGYQFSPAELQAALEQMSESTAQEINPGVGPRHHLPGDEQ